MKKMKITTVLVIPIILITILFFGFSFIHPNNVRSSNNFSTMNDSTHYNNRGGTMRRGGGMMGGGMMGRGMMGRGMMGRGMMGNGGTTQTSTNGTNIIGSWTAPASANNLTNPLKDIVKASRAGKNIFDAQCFTCHGTDGKGDGPAAVSLNPKPANLTSAKVQNQSDGAIFWKITTGNSPMPSFKYGLSKTQRWELVDYIRQLGK